MLAILFPFDVWFVMYSEIREGIIRCILATDMARHNEILTQFQEITSTFDYSNEAHINSVSFQRSYIPLLALLLLLILHLIIKYAYLKM